MTISFVSKLRFPEERGVAAADIAVCRAFAQLSHDVELLIPERKQKKEFEKKDLWEFYQVPFNLFTVKKLFCLDFLFLKNLYYFFMSWSFSIATLIYLIKNSRTYIHLFNESRELLILLKIFRIFYNPKIVFEVHDFPQNKYEKFLEKLAIDRANLILTTTNHFANYYSKFKTLVFPNGIFSEDFDYKIPKNKIRQILGLPKDKFIVGYAGRFLTTGMEKGIPELVRAVKKLNNKNILLLCVGGPLSKKYKEGIFIDFVPRKILYLYMRAFDICVMPFPKNNHYTHNMSPLKMFEYMASGNLILATDLPSIREVLNENIAYLVKPNELDKGIKYLYTHKQKRLAINALKVVKNKYTWEKRAQAEINAL